MQLKLMPNEELVDFLTLIDTLNEISNVKTESIVLHNSARKRNNMQNVWFANRKNANGFP